MTDPKIQKQITEISSLVKDIGVVLAATHVELIQLSRTLESVAEAVHRPVTDGQKADLQAIRDSARPALVRLTSALLPK